MYIKKREVTTVVAIQ